ncbi:Uncharacterized protein LOK49_LG13G01352 [Camellia lanceoleosa]|uniref:Uncharacterized protein n=1 Tax=Camellia lanceoleosa TaxID=1840588 RepID=A0ACC0FMI8_9ERIC|nr:Uncharacterized protein LOK49_LG13G01352 [Camellia lanceoleosa]
MTSRPPLLRRHNGRQLPPNSVAHSELVRRRGGLISVPGGKLTLPPEITRRFTKLLLNVNIQGSLGPVQVVMSPENAVGDLIKAAIEIYVKEMRRPLLNESDPRRLELHYSQFSLESLKAEEKLINLGSRNFYLCRKPTSVANSTCSNEAKKVAKSAFPFTKFMDFLL